MRPWRDLVAGGGVEGEREVMGMRVVMVFFGLFGSCYIVVVGVVHAPRDYFSRTCWWLLWSCDVCGEVFSRYEVEVREHWRGPCGLESHMHAGEKGWR